MVALLPGAQCPGSLSNLPLQQLSLSLVPPTFALTMEEKLFIDRRVAETRWLPIF